MGPGTIKKEEIVRKKGKGGGGRKEEGKGKHAAI